MMNNPWSDKEDKFLQHWFKNGKTIEELANRHKRTEISIRSRLQKFGLIRRSKITYILKPENSYISEEVELIDCETDKKNSCDVETEEYCDEKNLSDLEKANSLANLYAYNQNNILEPNLGSEDWSDTLDDFDGCDWMEIVNYVEFLYFFCFRHKNKKRKTYRKLTIPKQ